LVSAKVHTPVVLMPKRNKIILGIDIGGTKVELCRFNSSFQCLKSQRLSTKQVSSQGSLNPALVGQAARLHMSGVQRVGVAIKGVVGNGKLKSSSLFSEGKAVNVSKTLGKILGVPISLVNDVEAMALAEQRFGAGRMASSFVLVNLGTGIRAVYVQEGRCLVGTQGTAGEISHLFPVFSRKQAPVGSLVRIIAPILVQVSAFYDPKVIVLQGGVGRAMRRVLPQLISEYRRLLPRRAVPSRVTVSKLEHAGSLGAALVAPGRSLDGFLAQC